MRRFIVICLGIISLLYLLNPTAGIFEFIPDNMPFVGNLDEGVATTLLLMCLGYFGLNPTKIFEKTPDREKNIES